MRSVRRVSRATGITPPARVLPRFESVSDRSFTSLELEVNTYKGASHGMCSTEKDRVNADLLEFLKA